MDARAINKAKQRLRVAMESSAKLEHASNYEQYSDNWYMFLHAAKGIYTVIEQGAKLNAQARQWYGGKKQERRSDSLLRYIYEARNDDEHGVDDVTEKVEQAMVFGVNKPGASNAMRDQYGNTFFDCGAAWKIEGASPSSPNLPVLTALDGKKIASEFRPERVILKPVQDRSRVVYNPPTSHMGAVLKTDDPREVARLALIYLGNLIKEAEGFCKP